MYFLLYDFTLSACHLTFSNFVCGSEQCRKDLPIQVRVSVCSRTSNFLTLAYDGDQINVQISSCCLLFDCKFGSRQRSGDRYVRQTIFSSKFDNCTVVYSFGSLNGRLLIYTAIDNVRCSKCNAIDNIRFSKCAAMSNVSNSIIVWHSNKL